MLLNKQRLNHRNLLLSRINYHRRSEFTEKNSHRLNEIHTEDETRKLRAEKYCRLINEQKDSLLWPLFLVSFMDLIVMLIGLVINDRFITLYNYLCAGYITFFSLYYIYMKSLAEKVRIELSMSREQWEDNRYNIKREKKFILTNRGLTGYLAEMAKGGWLLASVTPFTYSFKKSDIADITYTIDTPSYMITRHSDMNINDKKDWYGINNDWQIQSVRDAEQNGWSYVCSLQNKTIIYSGDKNSVTPLNDNKYDNSLTFISLIGKIGILTIILTIIGFFIGLLVGILTS